MEGEKEIRQKQRGDARWMRFHRGRRDAVCALLKKVSGAERKHTEDASSNVGGVEGATRGGQLRRRASGDRALKGPTPHAPSSCQLSFLSLLLPLLPSLSFSLFLCASGANAPFKFLLVSFRTSLLSFLIPLSSSRFRFSYLDELPPCCEFSRLSPVSTG